MIQHIPVQYLCSENNYHFSRFTHELGREVPSLLDLCLSYYAKNVQLLQNHMKSIPAELIQQIYNCMITNNLLAPRDLHLFKNSMHQMTIDGSVENGEDFLASYCSVQRNITSPDDSNNRTPTYFPNDHTPDDHEHTENAAEDHSNSYFNLTIDGNNNTTCDNNYFYGENDYKLHILFGKSIQTSLFDLKEASMVTDLALDDFEDDQVLKKLPSNLKHLSVRWCKLSGNDSLSFLHNYCNTLQSLRLSSVELKSLRFLSDLTCLTFLDLSINPNIMDSEIGCLSKMTKLATLDLDATGITSAAIPIITKSHPNLVCLNLSGTAVTTKGLEQALVLKNLKVISVMSTNCTSPPRTDNKDVIIIGDYMTKQDARDAAKYSSFFSRAVQLRLIFGYYKLVANSRSRPHWPWFVQNILDMAKSSVRNEKLVEMALLFLWGEVCGEAMPEDLLNVAHKPVIASVTTICEYGGINTISKIMEYYVKNHRANGSNVLLFAIGLLTVASHNNKMSQTLMHQNKIVPLVLDAFQTYEKTEPSFQKFVLGVLIQLSANVQCHAQISAEKKIVNMCVLDCLNIKEYVKHQQSHKFVLALRSTAVLYNLSCWRSNTNKLLEHGILDSIAEILSTNKQSMTELPEASSYFDPLAIATLANLCRKGVCSVYSFTRWQKVIGLAVNTFLALMKSGQLQLSPPTNICYEFCSINNWDLARSLVALYVNCLTVEPYWSQRFLELYINEEIINAFLQYASIVDSEGQILLAYLFCLILDGSKGFVENRSLIEEQIEQSMYMMRAKFPTRFCSYIWRDVAPVHFMAGHSSHPPVQRWCIAFLEANSKTNLRIYRPPKRPLGASDCSCCDPAPKRKKEANANGNLLELDRSLHTDAREMGKDIPSGSVGEVVF